jgi:hypothetical protein
MRKTYHVDALWDSEAKVWVSKSDLPGLVIETATLAEFEALIRDLAPDLIADNVGPDIEADIEWTARGVVSLEAA